METEAIEIKEERTLFAKVYDLGGGRRQMRASQTPIHYADADGMFQDIDTTIENGRVCKCAYDISLYTDKIGYHGVDPSGNVIEAELEVSWKAPKIEDNVATYEDVQNGVDLIIEFMPFGIRMYRLLKNAGACKEAIYRLKNGQGVTDQVLISGSDDEDRKAEVSTEKLSKSEDNTEVRYKQIWTGRIAVMDKTTRKKSWSDDVKYPITID